MHGSRRVKSAKYIAEPVDTKPDIRTILFDFDGTLADTVHAGVATFNELAQEYGFLEITPDNADFLRAKGPRGAMKALAVPMIRVPMVVRSLRSGVRAVLPSLGFIVGMRAAVLALKAQGYQLGIVTSNSEENVRAFLANNQAEVFDFVQASAGIFNKGRKIKRLMASEGLKKDETVFIGDEIRDIEAARKNGIAVVSVTWGVNSRDGLEAAGSDFITETAGELMALFN
jgi:phosphoglycolate phosphatase